MQELTIRGKQVPRSADGYGELIPYEAAGHALHHQGELRPTPDRRQGPQLLASLRTAVEACSLRDGAAISFHHHLRNGDAVLNAVLDAAAALGLRNLTVAATALFPVHAPLIEHIRSGVVGSIWTGYVSGPLAACLSEGCMDGVLVLQSHGGRARAIASGQLRIDAAFIAAPAVDAEGAATGGLGAAACGPLGYPIVDADHARRVVLVTDTLLPDTIANPEIKAGRADYIVQVPSIGDPAGIVSGTTRLATDPASATIAAMAADVIAASGVLHDGFSFQTGAGGISLAVSRHIGERMAAANIRGGFISGGITKGHVELLNAGLFARIHDVQSFDLDAVRSFRANPQHEVMSAAQYASPLREDSVASRLSAMILGAAEIDRHFNVNVTTASNGRLIGGPGGHPDTAAGAQLTIVTTRTASSQFPKIVDRVACVTTPGRDIDVLVTERGIAVNPRRPDLLARLVAASLPLVFIEDLVARGPCQPAPRGRLIGLMEYRDGSIIDTLHAIE